MLRTLVALALALGLSCPAFAQTNPGKSPLTIPKGGTGASDAPGARTKLGVAIGTNVQAWDSDLDCIAAISSAGIITRTGAGTCAARQAVAPAAGITITNPAGTAGNITFALANDLAAVEGLSGTGFAVRTGTDLWAQRSISGTSNEVCVTNGDGVAGNPTLGICAGWLSSAHTWSGVQTLAAPVFTGISDAQGTLKLSSFVTATQITAAQNNYTATDGSNTCTTKTSLRLSSDASRNVTGLSCSQAEGDIRVIHNIGAQAIVLTNQDAGSLAANRFLFGGDMTLAADTSVTIRYDGVASRWRAITTPGAGGGGGGVTSVAIAAGEGVQISGTCTITTSGTCTVALADRYRQNALLTLIYQSKSFAEYRRAVTTFATGFKGASDSLNGILTGSSSNYVVTPGAAGAANGSVAPSATAGSDQTSTHTAATTGGNSASASSELAGNFQAWRAFDKVIGSSGGAGTWITNSVTTGWLQYQFGSAKTIASYTLTSANGLAARMANAWTLKGSNTGSFSGEETTLDTRSGETSWTSGGQTRTYSISSPASFSYYRLTVTANNGDGTYLEIDEMTLVSAGTPNNMTLVTTAQTSDSSVSNGRVLIEFDNSAAPALNTDITVEVTGNGGTNWASATLSAVTSYSQGARKVVETADTSFTSGTDFRARVKTLNNKNVPIYGISLSVH